MRETWVQCVPAARGCSGQTSVTARRGALRVDAPGCTPRAPAIERRLTVTRGALLWQALLRTRGRLAGNDGPHDDTPQLRPGSGRQRLECRSERGAQISMAMTQQLRERRRPWRLCEALRC